MPLELISGKRRAPERQQEQEIPKQPPQQAGLLEKALYYPARGLEQTGQSLAQVAANIGGFQLPGGPQPTEQIIEKFGYTPESFEPQNLGETFLQHVGESAIPALGSGGLRGLMNTLAGSTLATGGAALGASPEIQQGLKLGGNILAQRYGGKISGGLFGGSPSLSQQQQSAYSAARESAKSSPNIKAPEITQSLNAVVEALETESNEGVISKIEKMVQRAGNLIQGGVTPNKVLDARKKLNQFAKTLPENVREEYITPLRNGYNEYLANYSAQNAEFGANLNKADRLTAMKHVGSTISDYIKKIPNITGADLLKFGLKGISKLGAEQGEKFIRRVVQHPTTALPYYFKMGEAAFRNDPQSFMTNLKNLSNSLSPLMPGVNQSRSMNIFQEKPKSQLTLLKGRQK